MKISLKNIPSDGVTLQEELSLSDLNTRMSTGRANDIVFTVAPLVELRVIPAPEGFEVAGSVRSKYIQPCPRCLEEIECELTESIRVVLRERPGEVDEEDRIVEEDWEGDLGILYYQGDKVDLTDVIQETLILTLSPYGVDHAGCKGFTPPAEESAEKTDHTLAAHLRKLKLQ